MTCPNCVLDFDPPITVQGLTVHPACGASIVVATGERAKAEDVVVLTDDELRQLRAARLRPKRAAV